MDENKKKALAAALGQIERQFGKGTVMRMGDSSAARDIEVISTGSLGWILPSASAVCLRDVSSKFTARNLPVKPP